MRPKIWSVFNQFDITIPCWATYFLEVGVSISLKVATKGSPRGKKKSEKLDFEVVFVNQKWRSATKMFEVFLNQFDVTITWIELN